MRIKLEHIAILLILISAVSRLLMPQLLTLSLYIIIPGLFFWRTLTDSNTYKSKCVMSYTAMVVWAFIATAFADNVSMAINGLIVIAGGFMLSIVFYSMSRNSSSNSSWLLVVWLVYFVAMIIYMNNVGLLQEIDPTEKERLNDDVVNANDIAYHIFYAVISVVLLSWGVKERKLNKVLCFVLMCALIYGSIELSILTASRQILIVVLPLAIFSLLYRLFDGDKKKLVFAIAVVACIAPIAISSLEGLIEDTYLMARLEGELEEDPRTPLIQKAIEVGMQNPLLGVGPSNFQLYANGAFSHCSYTEIFACTGVLGLLLYVYMCVEFIRVQYTYYRTTKDARFLYLVMVGIMWILYNFLYVFYMGVWLIPFFFGLLGYSENIYNQLQHKRALQ